MENIYKVSHTAFPDGSIVEYSDGMSKPEILNLGHVIKKSLLNAVKQNRVRATEVIKMNAGKRTASPMYAVK